jgi:hypothetical protein
MSIVDNGMFTDEQYMNTLLTQQKVKQQKRKRRDAPIPRIATRKKNVE